METLHLQFQTFGDDGDGTLLVIKLVEILCGKQDDDGFALSWVDLGDVHLIGVLSHASCHVALKWRESVAGVFNLESQFDCSNLFEHSSEIFFFFEPHLNPLHLLLGVLFDSVAPLNKRLCDFLLPLTNISTEFGLNTLEAFAVKTC